MSESRDAKAAASEAEIALYNKNLAVKKKAAADVMVECRQLKECEPTFPLDFSLDCSESTVNIIDRRYGLIVAYIVRIVLIGEYELRSSTSEKMVFTFTKASYAPYWLRALLHTEAFLKATDGLHVAEVRKGQPIHAKHAAVNEAENRLMRCERGGVETMGDMLLREFEGGVYNLAAQIGQPGSILTDEQATRIQDAIKVLQTTVQLSESRKAKGAAAAAAK